MKLKKWLFPVSSAIISVVLFFFFGFLGILGNGDGTGYGGAVIILCCIIFYIAIVMPVMCFGYSKHCLSGRKHRLLFTLYHSFLISTLYLVYFCLVNAVYFAPLIFIWCELWGLLGLIRKKSSEKQETD